MIALDTIQHFTVKLMHFFYMQVLFSIILFIIIAIAARLLKHQSRFLLLGLWGLIFIRLVLPVEWSHELSGRRFVENFVHIPQIQKTTIPEPPQMQSTIYNVVPITVEEVQPVFWTSTNCLTVLWLAGIIILGLLYLKQLVLYNRLIHQAELCKNPFMIRMIEEWKREFNIRRNVRLVIGTSRKPPFTMGLFKPVIFIPKGFFEKSYLSTLESIIAHEMVHIKNYDDLWIKLQNMIQIVYFFNPIIWLAGIQLGQVREQFCDALVLSRKRMSKEVYGNGLLDIVQFNISSDPLLLLLPTFASKKERLLERIKNIKTSTHLNKWHLYTTLLFLIILGFVLLPMGNQSFSDTQVRKRFSILQSPIPHGRIVLEFGKDWDFKTNRYYFHKGVDINYNRSRENIVASADGKVISTGGDEIFTDFREITIQHENGLKTRYLHVDSLFIKPDQIVKQGQTIGSVRSCVHFEVYQDDVLKDPEEYISLDKKLVRSVIKEDTMLHY